MRPRDLALERELTELAARHAGHTTLDPAGRVVGNVAGLDDFADVRAHPGGVRRRDLDREAREELADCRNYLVWAIEADYAGYLAGDLDAGRRVAHRLAALSKVIGAWHDLT